MRNLILAAAAAALCAPLCGPARAGSTPDLDALIARHAAANGIPAGLVHQVVRRESNYNPRASHAGNHGLMQIRHQTARGMGYRGGATGLLDANTNLTYACAYLAGAYRAAHGNAHRAMALYRSGYYGVGGRRAPAPVPVPQEQVAAVAAAVAAPAPAQDNFLAKLFGKP